MEVLVSNDGSRTSFEFLRNESFDFLNNKFKKANKLFNEEILNKDISIGLEFEFHLNDGDLENLIRSLGNTVDKVIYAPEDFNIQDKDLDAWTIERDGTLINPNKNGFELVSPKLDINSALFYIENMLELINLYGSTDSSCGFHFHISSNEELMQDLDPVKMMLFLDEGRVLEKWKNRSTCNIELMDIFKNSHPGEFEENFFNLSRMYTIAARHKYKLKNHLEVRAIGGSGYEKKIEDIKKDFIDFVNIYNVSCSNTLEQNKYNTLKKTFFKSIEQTSSVNMNEIIKHANEKININGLNNLDLKEILETSMFELEDKGDRLVPTRKLVNEIETYVENRGIDYEQ